MAKEKKYSAQEAAMVVLSKAQELLGKSEFFKAEKLKKEGSIQAGISAAGAAGGIPHTQTATPQAVQSGISSAFGKSENPDEKQDAKLGEDVEGLCERHMTENKAAERKEGHKLVKSEMCKMCKSMNKSEFKELYEELAKVESLSKSEQTENKEDPSKAPEDTSKPVERDRDDFEAKPGKDDSPDHREATQTPPSTNPKEKVEGNNPPSGAIPGNGLHKLMYFTGHMHAKKKLKKGIAVS